jgi:hypothetical protein
MREPTERIRCTLFTPKGKTRNGPEEPDWPRPAIGRSNDCCCVVGSPTLLSARIRVESRRFVADEEKRSRSFASFRWRGRIVPRP